MGQPAHSTLPLLSNPKPLPTPLCDLSPPPSPSFAGGRIADGELSTMSLSSTAKFAELPSITLLFSPKRTPSPFRRLFFAPFSAARSHDRRPSSSTSTSAPWLEKWPAGNSEPSPKSIRKEDDPDIAGGDGGGRGRGAIERIVLRLRNLGLGDGGEEGETGGLPLDGEERLGDLLNRTWVRPDLAVLGVGEESSPLPWERDEEGYDVVEAGGGVRRKRVKAPTLAELTIDDSELRRLRREGIVLRERITIPKAGVTQAVLEKIHSSWRKAELVRLKFHESLAHDMKTAHEIVEVTGPNTTLVNRLAAFNDTGYDC